MSFKFTIENKPANINKVIEMYPLHCTYRNGDWRVGLLFLAFSASASAAVCGYALMTIVNLFLFKTFHLIPAPAGYWPCFALCLYPFFAQKCFNYGVFILVFAWAVGLM